MFWGSKTTGRQIIDEYDAPLLDVAHDMDKLDKMDEV